MRIHEIPLEDRPRVLEIDPTIAGFQRAAGLAFQMDHDGRYRELQDEANERIEAAYARLLWRRRWHLEELGAALDRLRRAIGNDPLVCAIDRAAYPVGRAIRRARRRVIEAIFRRAIG